MTKLIIQYHIQPFLLRFKVSKRRLIYLAFGGAAFLIAYSTGRAVPDERGGSRDIDAGVLEANRGDGSEWHLFEQRPNHPDNVCTCSRLSIWGVLWFCHWLNFQRACKLVAHAREVSPLVLLITPFGIMEVFVYGLAMSRSAMLIYYLLKRMPWRKYAIPTLIELGIAIGVLFIAAVIEWQIIERLGGLDASIAIDPVES